ncbi:MAG: hypothetical protein QG646_2462 [Euryarchaeota archaeon]|nr:hypothetical protein [Euryarchaeota archaeon]
MKNITFTKSVPGQAPNGKVAVWWDVIRANSV